MKKLISYLLVTAILLGCFAPVGAIAAKYDPTITAETVEKIEGTGADVSPKITISDNPGIYYMKLIVYYDKTQLAKSDADAFEGAIFNAADSSIGSERNGNHKDIKAYIPAELQDSSKGFIIYLCGTYDEDLGDTAIVTENGLAVNLPLEIIAEDYGTFNYTVVVAEAYDADGEEIYIDDVFGTVIYSADPYIGIYDDFTVFMTPDEKDITVGTKNVRVDIRFDNNPGLWATRIYVVYPEALTIGSANNVVNNYYIYTSPADLIVGTPDLALDDPKQVKGFQDVMAADPSIVRDGYHSTTIYFEPAAFDKVNSGNGILCTLNFTVSDDVEAGDILDIQMYYGEADFLYAGTDSNGVPEFIDYYPDTFGAEFKVVDFVCTHANTVTDVCDATCGTAGYYRVYCNDCGKKLIDDEIQPTRMHVSVAPVITPATCTTAGKENYYCDVCGENYLTVDIPATGHNLVNGTCTVCGKGCTITAENVEKIQGTGTDVSPAITIAGNPGISYMKLIVYYDKTQLAKSDADAFEGAIFDAADSAISSERAGTHKDLKNYIPYDLQATSRGFVVDLFGEYNEELGDTMTVIEDGVVVNLPLKIIADEFGTFNYTVVAEAYDENGDEIIIDNVYGTVEYKADPNIGIYDNFTVFMTPSDIEVLEGTKNVSVDIRFDNNPGLWATRIYIVYPEALTLVSESNVVNPYTIYTDPADLIVGTPDIALDDPRQVQVFQDLMAADPSIVRDGYHSTTIYFESISFDKVNSGNGILCTLNFTIASDVEIGDVLDIEMYYGEADFLYAGTADDGSPEFIMYEPDIYGAEISVVDVICEHTSMTTVSRESTCGENGYLRDVCLHCGRTVHEIILPATGNHEVGRSAVKNPTCTEDGEVMYMCGLCGTYMYSEVIPAPGHSYLSTQGTVITPPTCTEDGYTTKKCDYCGEPRVMDPVPAWGHDTDGEQITVAPTCISNGYIYYHCSLCGGVIDTDVISAPNAHKFIHIARVEATCFTSGNIEYWYCELCHKQFSDSNGYVEVSSRDIIIPARGYHIEDEPIIIEPNCFDSGSKTVYCVSCGEIVIYEEYPPQHNEGDPIVIDPTCTAKGNMIYRCIDCGEITRNEIIPAKGHNLYEVVIEEPGCTEEGLAGYYCSDCGKLVETRALPAVGHIIDRGTCTTCGATNIMPEGLEYASEIYGIIITGYNGTADELYIPSSIDGLPVKGIASCAFYDNKTLRLVYIPEGVEFIGDNAFFHCAALEEIYIPTTMAVIGEFAFDGCFNLSSVYIEDVAAWCNIAFVQGSSYHSCGSSNPICSNHCYYLGWGKNTTTTLYVRDGEGYTTDVVIPADLESINRYAFYGYAAPFKLIFEDGTTWIDASCFNVSPDTVIYIPESVEAISGGFSAATVYFYGTAEQLNNFSYAFWDCTVIANYAGSDGMFEYIRNEEDRSTVSVFRYFCNGNTKVTIPEEFNGYTVTGILPYVFAESPKIKHLILPSTLTYIGEGAFMNCARIGYITMGENVAYIGERAFENTNYYNNEKNWVDGVLYIGNAIIKANETVSGTVEIKNGSTVIATCAFTNCDITKVIISGGAEKLSIGEHAFLNVSEIYILDSASYINCISDVSVKRVYYVGSYNDYCEKVNGICIYGGPGLICNYGTPMEGFYFDINEDAGTIKITGYGGQNPDVVIPAEYNGYRVTAIEPGAFWGNTNITSIVIPGTIEFIEENTFRDCVNLISVTIGEGTCEIGDYAFSECSSLERIILPESIVYIWTYAFNKCVSLTTVYFPSCLEIIEYKAFYRCENIYDVTYNGSPSEFKKIYLGNGNDPILMTDINYLEEDEARIVMIPVPEGMDPEDCQLYFVDENGVATALQVEFVDGHFVVVEAAGQEEMTGYYIVRNSAGDDPTDPDEPDEPDVPVVPDIPEGVIVGDVDGDGRRTALDANALQRIVSGLVEVEAGSDKFIAADITGDGKVNVADINMIKRLITGAITI